MRKKHQEALWKTAFPSQVKDGQRERKDEELRLYLKDSREFKKANPWCRICAVLRPGKRPRKTTDTHHVYGRGNGLLRRFDLCLPSCRPCHTFVDNNRDEARRMGLLAPRGEFNKGPKL